MSPEIHKLFLKTKAAYCPQGKSSPDKNGPIVTGAGLLTSDGVDPISMR